MHRSAQYEPSDVERTVFKRMNNIEDLWADGAAAMRALWNGRTILASARAVVDSVSPGPATFISTSTEGSALAAVCAAIRGDNSQWRRVNLLSEAECPEFDGPVVFVESISVGTAWVSAIRARYPDATIVTTSHRYALSAASAAAAA